MNDRDSTFYAGAIAAGAFVGATIWLGLTFGLSEPHTIEPSQIAATLQCWPVIEIAHSPAPLRGCIIKVSADGRTGIFRTCDGRDITIPRKAGGRPSRVDCEGNTQFQPTN